MPTMNSEMPTLPQQLRKIRKARGLSQYALAHLLGVKQPVVARWESGRCQLLLSTVERYAEAVGYKVRVVLSRRRGKKA